MKKEKVNPLTKLLSIGVLIITIIIVVLGSINLFTNQHNYRILNYYTLIKPKSITFEYSKGQYDNAITEAEIEFRLKMLSARISLIMSTLVQLDALYDSDNESFTDNQFTDALVYCDWVNYGSSQVKASNTLEGKTIILNNAVDTLNHYNDEINVFIYGLDNNKVFAYKHIWKDINKDTEKLNELIITYNKTNKTDLMKIHEIRSIGEKQ